MGESSILYNLTNQTWNQEIFNLGLTSLNELQIVEATENDNMRILSGCFRLH